MKLRDAVTGTLFERGEGPHGGSAGERPAGLRAVRDGSVVWVFFRGDVYRIEKVVARGVAGADLSHDLAAPMPGKVRAVLVAEGEAVKKGATLLLLEAMKMEHPVRAPRDGRVRRLLAAEGAMVAAGERLLEIE